MDGLMTLDEMRQHKWRVSWSGGKDSTATIILMHENDIPIDRICYVRMMYNDHLPATLPVMTNFVDGAMEEFRSWGYQVDVVKSKKTAYELTEKYYEKSIKDHCNGHKYGITAFMRGMCRFQREKPNAINSIAKADYEMIGYAADEVDRIGRLGNGKQSILVALNVKEQETFTICRKYNLLSPLYEMGIGRDGCFFCPNCGKREIEFLKENYPELVEEIYRLIDKSPCKSVFAIQSRNTWCRDYVENGGLFVKKSKEDDEDPAQMRIEDFL